MFRDFYELPPIYIQFYGFPWISIHFYGFHGFGHTKFENLWRPQEWSWDPYGKMADSKPAGLEAWRLGWLDTRSLLKAGDSDPGALEAGWLACWLEGLDWIRLDASGCWIGVGGGIG